MNESGDQKHGWQEDSNADKISSKEDLSDKNEMVNLNAPWSRKYESSENLHETVILSKDKMVAGAGFEPTTFGLWARRAARLLHPASEWRIVS